MNSQLVNLNARFAEILPTQLANEPSQQLDHNIAVQRTGQIAGIWSQRIGVAMGAELSYDLSNMASPKLVDTKDLFTNQELIWFSAHHCTESGIAVIDFFVGQSKHVEFTLSHDDVVISSGSSGHLFDAPVDNFRITASEASLSLDIILATRDAV